MESAISVAASSPTPLLLMQDLRVSSLGLERVPDGMPQVGT